jgi:hypothetical protein
MPLTDEETAFFEMRDRLLQAAQNREMTIRERMDEILRLAGTDLSGKSDAQWIAVLMEMEALDPARNDVLSAARAENLPALSEEWDTALEQLLVYFLMRHRSGFLDGNIGVLSSRAAFAVISCRIIRRISAAVLHEKGNLNVEDIAEAARLYSSEYEYSEENMEKLLAVLDS